MEVGRNSLGKLMQFGGKKEVPELRLADQYQLQNLKLVRVDIRDHSQVLERFRLQVLGFIDDQDRAPPVGVLSVEKILQVFEKIWIISFEGLAKRHQDPL